MASGERARDGEAIDGGLLAFVLLRRLLGKPADAAQLQHQFAPDGEAFTTEHILRAAKRFDVKARRERVTPERLDKAVLPAIARSAPRRSRKRRDLQRLVSPIDGTVTNLAAWTVGGVVKPGATILNIVPASVTPEIEAMVLNKDIGFVSAGQRVTVKLDAFPFARFGTVDGEVIDVSRDANKDDKLGLIYPVRVRLDAADINVEGKRVAIAPGMAVSAEIVTGNRRVIEYLLSPVLRYRSEAARER